MAWMVADPSGLNPDIERVRFFSEQAAKSQARFLNERDSREEEDVD